MKYLEKNVYHLKVTALLRNVNEFIDFNIFHILKYV